MITVTRDQFSAVCFCARVILFQRGDQHRFRLGIFREHRAGDLFYRIDFIFIDIGDQGVSADREERRHYQMDQHQKEKVSFHFFTHSLFQI